MDIQEQIAFEKFQAKECNCDYNELKRRLDRQEKVMGHRYIPSSPRHEAWLVWDAAWQAKAQAVPECINDIQAWIAKYSFSALDASIVDFPVVDANELAEFIDSLNIDVAVPEGFVLVPKVPTEEMIQIGAKANSECLNDNAPLGERLYRHPAIQVYTAMVAGLEKSHD